LTLVLKKYYPVTIKITKRMKHSLFKLSLCLIFSLPVFFYFINPKICQSAPATNFKDQLSSAQLSYADTLTASNAADNSIAYVNTNNYNLDIGDTLTIGTGTYIVTGLIGTDGIALNIPLASGDADNGDVVKAARQASHTISFEPLMTFDQGKWQVLIKAASSNNSDGTADSTGFDSGNFAASGVTCPWGATASIGTTILSTNTYQMITCSLGGTNPVGTGATGTIIIGTGDTMLINPAPAASHTVGQANSTADTYSVILRFLDPTGTILDTIQGKIAVTESVRVTATVDPTITFSIGNSGVTTPSTSLCGTPIGSGASNTTGATVNFGSLNLTAFNNLAQFLQCTTNAANGYAIQTFESTQLTMVSIGDSSTIPDTTCPSAGTCNSFTAAAWTTNSTSGFGYALQVGSTSAGAVLGITTSGQYKAFGVGYDNAETILSRSDTPADIDSAYICYRVTVSTQQPAGTYQNEINFIATATF
jgi:hypothetical protein